MGRDVKGAFDSDLFCIVERLVLFIDVDLAWLQLNMFNNTCLDKCRLEKSSKFYSSGSGPEKKHFVLWNRRDNEIAICLSPK